MLFLKGARSPLCFGVLRVVLGRGQPSTRGKKGGGREGGTKQLEKETGSSG